ncbi:MAG: hypothetical protein QXQ53_04725 [Candidatus Methanosuratincola sp.]
MFEDPKITDEKLRSVLYFSELTLKKIKDVERRLEKLSELEKTAAQEERKSYEEARKEYDLQIRKILDDYRSNYCELTGLERDLNEQLSAIENDVGKKNAMLKVERELNEDPQIISFYEQEIRNAEEKIKEMNYCLERVKKAKDELSQYYDEILTDKKSNQILEAKKSNQDSCNHSRKIRVADVNSTRGLAGALYACLDCGKRWRE